MRVLRGGGGERHRGHRSVIYAGDVGSAVEWCQIQLKTSCDVRAVLNHLGTTVIDILQSFSAPAVVVIYKFFEFILVTFFDRSLPSLGKSYYMCVYLQGTHFYTVYTSSNVSPLTKAFSFATVLKILLIKIGSSAG